MPNCDDLFDSKRAMKWTKIWDDWLVIVPPEFTADTWSY